VISPDVFPNIVGAIYSLNSQGTAGEIPTTGWNMANETSMPALGASTMASGEHFISQCEPGAAFDGFGDDYAGVGKPQDRSLTTHQLLTLCREQQGFKEKPSASGGQELRGGSLTVITEQYFSRKDGVTQQIDAAKPSGLVRSVLSVNPHLAIATGVFAEGDFAESRGSLAISEPWAASFLSGGGRSRPVRTTSSRRATMQWLQQFPSPPGALKASPQETGQTLRQLESALLMLLPSTRGRPQYSERRGASFTATKSQINAAQRVLVRIHECGLHEPKHANDVLDSIEF
jgi:hypothetical protein